MNFSKISPTLTLILGLSLFSATSLFFAPIARGRTNFSQLAQHQAKCKQESVAAGFSASVADQLCSCLIQRAQEQNIPESDFRSILEGDENNRYYDRVIQIGEDCAAEVS